MLSLFDNKKIVCGVDEAGRGSLAGPVTAAAVILPKNYKNSFIKDSKKINFYPVEEHGIDGDFVESQAFAYLAIRSYLKLPISFPSTTRSKKAISGGDILQNF